MHSLSELKQHMIGLGYKIGQSVGWYFIVGKDRYSMLDSYFYLNNERLTKKELLTRLKTQPKPKSKPAPNPLPPPEPIQKPKAKKKAKAKKPKPKKKSKKTK